EADRVSTPQSARSEGVSLADVPNPEEPLKVVLAASWADDLLEEAPESISSLKDRPNP
ncbi:CPSF30, partial [Symbiodinium pilosum]